MAALLTCYTAPRTYLGVLLQLQLVFRRLDEGHEPTRLVVLVTEVDRVLGRETRNSLRTLPKMPFISSIFDLIIMRQDLRTRGQTE